MGQWKELNGSDTTEFRAEGRWTERPAGRDDPRPLLVRGAKLAVQLEGMGEELSFNVLIRSDVLEMTDSGGDARRITTASDMSSPCAQATGVSLFLWKPSGGKSCTLGVFQIDRRARKPVVTNE